VLKHGMKGSFERTSRNGGYFTPNEAGLAKVWLSRRAVRLTRLHQRSTAE
jgi:hypothetical protein